MTQDQFEEQATHQLSVSPEEAGQKLLQFMVRRLETPQSALHRWIRTGQVRLNGKRTQPFTRLHVGDLVRLPPFAVNDARLKDARLDAASPNDGPRLPFPSILFQTESLFVCVKSAGLPVHAGTGHVDSLTSRLHEHCADGHFMPTPAHRLDKPTSGLLLVARSYTALRLLHDALIAKDKLTKTYLAWVAGRCVWNKPTLLEDGILKEETEDGYERMRLVPLEEAGKKASLTALRLEERHGASLLSLTLHTGRTHQIRAQLAGRGLPILGDIKYGGPACDQGLLLHAAHLAFAPDLAQALHLPEKELYCAPPWQEPWAV